MMLLPLGKCILPVVMEELGKSCLAVDTEIHENCIGIMFNEVTELSEHFDHLLSVWGLGLVKLAFPHPFRVLGFALIGGV